MEIEEIKTEEGKSNKGVWESRKNSTLNENSTTRGQTSEFRLFTQGSTYSGTSDGQMFSDFDKGKRKDPWAKKRETRSVQRKEFGGNRHRKTNSHGNLRTLQEDNKINQSGTFFISLKKILILKYKNINI